MDNQKMLIDLMDQIRTKSDNYPFIDFAMLNSQNYQRLSTREGLNQLRHEYSETKAFLEATMAEFQTTRETVLRNFEALDKTLYRDKKLKNMEEEMVAKKEEKLEELKDRAAEDDRHRHADRLKSLFSSQRVFEVEGDRATRTATILSQGPVVQENGEIRLAIMDKALVPDFVKSKTNAVQQLLQITPGVFVLFDPMSEFTTRAQFMELI